MKRGKTVLFAAIAAGLSLAMVGGALELVLRWRYKPPISPECVKTHPHRRYTLRPGCRGTSLEAPLLVNALGLRERERAPDAAAYRVAVLGDSITFGQGVPAEETFSHQLELQLAQRVKTPVQVFNFGVPSYNTASEHQYLVEAFDRFSPNLVVVEFTASNDTIWEGGLKSQSPAQVWLKDLIRWSYTYEWFSRKIHQLRYQMSRDTKIGDREIFNQAVFADDYPGWRDAQNHITEMARFCRAKNVPLLFAIFANNGNLAPTAEGDRMYPVIQKIKVALRAAGVTHVVVFDDGFREYAGKEAALWVTPTDAHFSARAHELAANALLDHIETHREALRVVGWKPPLQATSQ